MPRTSTTERLGIAAISKAAQLADWFYRELPLPDEGIDMQLEASTDGRADGRMIGVQVKSGESYFRRSAVGGWRYTIEDKHLQYWHAYSLPVILVLYNPKTDEAYWQHFSVEFLEQTRERNYSIVIPNSKKFGPGSTAELELIAKEGLPSSRGDIDEALRRRRASFDLAWLEKIDSGESVTVEVDQPIQDASGSRNLRIIVQESSGKDRVEQQWPWYFPSDTTLLDELADVFPWADLAIDESRYRQETFAEFLVDMNAKWDEDSEAFDVDEDEFEAWFESRYLAVPPRPFGQDTSQNLAFWRLKLNLNDLGRQTLSESQEAIRQEIFDDLDSDVALAAELHGGHYGVGRVDHLGQDFCWIYLSAGPDGYLTETIHRISGILEEEEIARNVLAHVLGRNPTDALAACFRVRFVEGIEDPDWRIPLDELRDWLHYVETSGEPAQGRRGLPMVDDFFR